MAEAPDTVDDALEALSSPSTLEVELGTRAFSARELASSAARRAMEGGGGGGGSLADILSASNDADGNDIENLGHEGRTTGNIPTDDEYAAISDANSPGSDNVFATIADVVPAPFVGPDPPGSPTVGELWFDTDDDTPADGLALPLDLGPGLFQIDADGFVTVNPSNDNPDLAQFTVKGADGSRADGSEVFGVYDDDEEQRFGVDGVGGVSFNMSTTPFAGTVGFRVDGGSTFFEIGPSASANAQIDATGAAKFQTLKLMDLPTSDPAVIGAVWVDAAADFVLKVSQG